MKLTVVIAVISVVMAAVFLAILRNHGLTTFEKALIITVVGATITGMFTVVGAWIATKKIAPIHTDITDVKRKVDAANRVTDEVPGERS